MIVVVAGELTLTAAAVEVVLPQVEPTRGIGLMFTGVDGSTWDLCNGPVRALAGASGFGDADVVHRWSDLAGLDGSTWQGHRTDRRTIALPVKVLRQVSSLGFRDIDAAFSDATAPNGECELMVTTPDGLWRSLRLRRESGGDPELDLDPLLARHVMYPLIFTAGDPFWRGPTLQQQFTATEVPNLFPGPPFGIGASDTTANARLRNPGHVDVWPVYTLRGPADAFTITVGPARFAYASVPDGRENRVVVDTHPARQTVLTADGADAWLGVQDREFAPVPPGRDVPVLVSLTNPDVGASLSVQMVPGYRRVW